MKNLIYIFIFGLFSQSLFSQAGSVDASFGTNGSIVYNDDFIVSGSLIQPDGKIVVSGYESGITNAIVKRYNEDGSVDNSFNFRPGITNNFSAAFSIKQFSDGKLAVLTVATDDLENGPFHMRVIKVNTDGSKDTSFNSPNISPDLSNEFELFMGSNEKPGIIIYPSSSTTGTITLIRFLDTGEYDTTFGTNGEKEISVYATPMGDISFENKGNALISDDSGNFYFTFKMGEDFYISRTDTDFTTFTSQVYNNIGWKYTFYDNNSIYQAFSENTLQKFSASTLAPDNTYGINSIAGGNTSSFNFKDSGGFIQPDGKGVVVCAYDNTNMYITRFMSDGNVDTAFGTSGILNFNSDFPTGYNMSVHYSKSNKKLYIINVDEGSARFMMTRIDLGEMLSVSDINNSKPFSVYPNPVTDNIHFSKNIAEITITDMTGRVVLQRKVSDKKLNLSNLGIGTYIIIAKDKENNQYRQKIIKK